jgi:hypothetical protein
MRAAHKLGGAGKTSQLEEGSVGRRHARWEYAAQRLVGALAMVGVLVFPPAALAFESADLIQNPAFDTDLEGWNLEVFGEGSSLTWDPNDADGSVESGSIRIEVDANDSGNTARAVQCFGISAEQPVHFGASIFESTAGAAGSAFVRMQWWEEEGCTGNLGSADAVEPLVPDTWVEVERTDILPPPGTMSAQLFLLAFETTEPGNHIAHFDNVIVEVPEPSFSLSALVALVVVCGLRQQTHSYLTVYPRPPQQTP